MILSLRKYCAFIQFSFSSDIYKYLGVYHLPLSLEPKFQEGRDFVLLVVSSISRTLSGIELSTQ